MTNYTIFKMFENPRRGRQARNFAKNVPTILDLKSSSEQIFSRKLPLGAPASCTMHQSAICRKKFIPLAIVSRGDWLGTPANIKVLK